MPATISKTLRVLTRPSRSGQSIIIIALGFIALIAFVGIATDTAMLFVRYSTLRRAVDAAAIAAAGAIRQSNVAAGNGFATVAASAEQYIKIHGLDPSSVRVDTCATEVYDYMTKNSLNYTDPVAQAAATQYLAAQTGEELCTPQPQKLVRVSAQIKSPTSFLSLIGYNTITLSASSVSQTAVLDVALMLDASYSQGYDTGDKEVASGVTPATLDSFSDFTNLFPAGNNVSYDPLNPTGAVTGSHLVGSIRAECRTGLYASSGYSSNYAYGGCCNEPVTMSPPSSASVATTWYIAANGAINTAHVVSGENPEFTTASGVTPGKNYSALICKPFKYVRDSARQFLNSVNFAQGDRAFLVVFDQTVHELTSAGEYNNPDDTAAVTGTLPVFTDSDSAIQALNKYAGLEINSTGYQLTRQGGPCISNGVAPYNNNQRHLNNIASYPFYVPPVSLYETVAPCYDTNTGGAILAGQGVITNASWIRRTAVWVMVLLSDGYPNRTPGLTAVSGLGGSPAIGGSNTYGGFHPITSAGYSSGNPYNPAPGAYPNFFVGYPPAFTGNTNPGVTNLKVSALTRQALVDPGFCPWYTFCDPTAGNYPSWQTGQVWIPSAANLNSTTNYTGGQTYLAKSAYPDGYVDQVQTDSSGNQTIALNRIPDPNASAPVPNAMHYNSLYCPQTEIESDPIWWSVDGYDAQHVHYPVYWQTGQGGRIACTATDPDLRHFCMDAGTGAINPTDPTKCSLHYDPKDYARDMVDYAALIDYTSTVKGNSIAMYSIFFPHQASASADIADYILGVKFMRYVADAGSDGTIKNHAQAWFRQHNTQADPLPTDYYSSFPYDGSNAANYPTTTEDACAKYDFRELHVGPGSHGPISLPDYPYGTGYEDIYKNSCGNYYFADSASAISRAFVDIAGKLFTRLAH